MRSLRALAVAVTSVVALSACALTPVGSTPTPSSATPTESVLAQPTPTASPPSGPGWTIETVSHDDPARPVHLQWPVVPGATALNSMLHDDMMSREQRFLAEYLPSAESPPELQGMWEAVLDAPSWVGVRLEFYEFAGASGGLWTEVLYGEKMGGQALRSIDLIAPTARQSAVEAVVAALRSQGHEVVEESALSTDVQGQLFDDLVFSPRGELIVRVGEGVLLPNSVGVVEVTLPPSTTDLLLSEAGVHVRDTVIALTVPATPTPTPAPAVEPPPASTDCTVAQCVALTFDDGPGGDTERLLNDLAREGVHATFFVLGTAAHAKPEVVRRMVAEGHEVGNHTWSHKQLSKLSARAQGTEMRRGIEAITAAGATPTVFRPPYGTYNAATRSAAGLPIVLWDIDTLDWKTRSTEKTIEAALTAKAGSIVLMHDIHASTVDAVPQIVSGLRERGFTLVTVSQLLGHKEPGSVSSRR